MKARENAAADNLNTIYISCVVACNWRFLALIFI